MDDPNLITAVSSPRFLPTTSTNDLVMPFAPDVPSFPMPQSMEWIPMQQSPLFVPVTPHVVSVTPRFNKDASSKDFRPPTHSEPSITVFVGNIAEEVPNTMIRHILAVFGNIASWKRVEGFGYCEYNRAEDAMRAIKVLHDMKVGGKKLVVKVDANTQEILDQFKTEKKGAYDSEENQEFELFCRQRITSIITEHNNKLSKEGKQYKIEEKPNIVDGVGFDLVQYEDKKKNIISQEIGTFREVTKIQVKEDIIGRMKIQDKDKLNGIHGTPDNLDPEEIRSICLREKQEKKKKKKEERDKLEKDKQEKEKNERDKREREKKERRDEKKQQKQREKDVDISRSLYDKKRLRDKEIEEEKMEAKQEEDKNREKEIAFQEKCKQWEIRENQKKKERSKYKMVEEERERNAKKLKEFLEIYDDEKDDQKYYKGRELLKLIELRKKELEEDRIDLQKEKDERQDFREKVYGSDINDPECNFAMVLKGLEDMFKPKLLTDVAENQKDKLKPFEFESEKKIQKRRDLEVKQERFSPQQPTTPPCVEVQTLPPEFTLMTQSTTLMIKKRMDIKDELNNDDEEIPKPKYRKLIPLDYNDKKEKVSNAVEERNKNIRQLIERIPTVKDELFSFELDLSIVDNELMEMRIRPWINKKIIEYIGEPEPTFVDFICSKVLAGSSPQAILDDVQMLIDEEAELFVIKMWKLLVYEVEARKLGLVKLERNGHKNP